MAQTILSVLGSVVSAIKEWGKGSRRREGVVFDANELLCSSSPTHLFSPSIKLPLGSLWQESSKRPFMPQQTFNAQYVSTRWYVLALVATLGLLTGAIADELLRCFRPRRNRTPLSRHLTCEPLPTKNGGPSIARFRLWRRGPAPEPDSVEDAPSPSESDTTKTRRGRGRRDRLASQEASPNFRRRPLNGRKSRARIQPTNTVCSIAFCGTGSSRNCSTEYENKREVDRKQRVAVGLKVELDAQQLELAAATRRSITAPGPSA